MMEVTEEDYKDAILLIEAHAQKPDIFTHILGQAHLTPERAARLYIALLKVSRSDFPEKKRVSRFSYTLDDKTDFVAVYIIAAKGGITISALRKLYDVSKPPDMIYTTMHGKDESNEKREVATVELPGNIPETDMESTVAALLPDATCFRLSMSPYLSASAKLLKRKGAAVTSYSILYNSQQILVNRLEYKGKLHYDLNSFYCDNVRDFAKELISRLKNKSGR